MLRRVITTLCATAALVAVAAAPASADPPVPHLGHSLTVGGLTDGVFLNGLQIHATCYAQDTGADAAIVFTSCRLAGNPDGTNHPAAMPGNATATTFVEHVTTLDFQLCWEGYVVRMDDPENPYYFASCAVDPLPNGLGTIGFDTYTF